jgi:hypothetical protein
MLRSVDYGHLAAIFALRSAEEIVDKEGQTMELILNNTGEMVEHKTKRRSATATAKDALPPMLCSAQH